MAAIKAGYSSETAYQIGYENLRKPDIKKEIRRLKGALQEECFPDRTHVKGSRMFKNDKVKAEINRPKGGQPGNKNAVGHGAPLGNKNAYKYGIYERMLPLYPGEKHYRAMAIEREREKGALFYKTLLEMGYSEEELPYVSAIRKTIVVATK